MLKGLFGLTVEAIIKYIAVSSIVMIIIFIIVCVSYFKYQDKNTEGEEL